MKRYNSPSYVHENVETENIITASLEDNGEATVVTPKGDVVTGPKGTYSGWFSDIY